MVATTGVTVIDDTDASVNTCLVKYISSTGIATAINNDEEFFYMPFPDHSNLDEACLKRKKEPFYYNQKKSYKAIQDKHSRRGK